jgi:RNA polymerase sigma factor (sigma-70 family)
MSGSKESAGRPGTGAAFVTTLWSVVLTAGDPAAVDSRQALEKLCDAYWLPIYAFIRRSGHAPADAEDLTQGFFVSLFEHNSLAAIHPERGRFRSFLLASVRYYLADQHDRATALKRGGGRTPVSLEAELPEAFYARQKPDGQTPDRVFERSMAEALLARAQQRLREECVRAGKEAMFEDLGPIRSSERELSYAEVGGHHGISENAARLAAFRLRQRYQEIVADEVRQIVSSADEVEDEIRHLLNVLAD